MSAHALGPYHNIIRFPASSESERMFEQAEIVASIPARWPLHPSYMHTFGGYNKAGGNRLRFGKFLGVTENYFLIVEQPLSLSIPAMVTNKLIKNEPLAGCFRWYHDEKVNFIVTYYGSIY